MDDQLRIEVLQEDRRIPVVEMHGRLDAAAAQRLRDRCLALNEAGRKRLVVSLAGVTFVASSGFGSFLLLTEEFRDSGGAVAFAGASENVLRVIKLLNLEQFLTLVEDVDAAREALEGQPVTG